MVNRQFVKTSLISSLLFFIIATVLDFLLTWSANDLVSYILFFALSLFIFGPIIATLVTDYKETHIKRKINLQI